MKNLDKYNELPLLAKWKALIIEYGLYVAPDLFDNFSEINSYKTKNGIKCPIVKNFKFSDISNHDYIVPAEIIMNTEGKKSLVKVGFRNNSPISLELHEGDPFLVKRSNGKRIPLKINFVTNRRYANERIPKNINNDEPFLKDFVQMVGLDRISIMAFEGCWHWISEKPCLFCDANPKRDCHKSSMPSLNTLIDSDLNEDEWWNKNKKKYLEGIAYTFKYILEHEEITPHKHLQLMAGDMIRSDKSWDICREIAEELNKIKPISSFDSYLNLAVPKKDVAEYLMIAKKEMGFKQIQFNLEVVGEHRFKEVCPGKSRLNGYKRTMDALKKSVEIFGHGNVRSNFVLGAQPIEELLDGIKLLAEYGIVADYSIFVPKRGTKWEKRQSPSMETIVGFTNKLAEIYRKHDFSSIYCGLSSRSNILYEILDK